VPLRMALSRAQMLAFARSRSEEQRAELHLLRVREELLPHVRPVNPLQEKDREAVVYLGERHVHRSDPPLLDSSGFTSRHDRHIRGSA